MKTRVVVGIVVGIAILIGIGLLFGRGSRTKTYVLSGKVTMVNDCSGDIDDLPDRIRMVFVIHYTDPNAQPDQVEKQFDAVPTGQVEKTAEYRFESETNLTIDYWEYKEIRRNGETVCPPIECESGFVCRDHGQKVHRITLPAGETEATKDWMISCGCQGV